MVEQDGRGQARQQRLELDDLVALDVELHVPAEIVDPSRQRLEPVDGGGGAGMYEIEADAAHARAREAPQLLVADDPIHPGNATRLGAPDAQRLQPPAVVGAAGPG